MSTGRIVIARPPDNVSGTLQGVQPTGEPTSRQLPGTNSTFPHSSSLIRNRSASNNDFYVDNSTTEVAVKRERSRGERGAGIPEEKPEVCCSLPTKRRHQQSVEKLLDPP